MLYVLFLNLEVLMTCPTLHITNGPAERDLELAFVGRRLGATVEFTVFLPDAEPSSVRMEILNFYFVTCHGPVYELGGILTHIPIESKSKLPPFNFMFVKYHAQNRNGTMMFSNGG